MAHSIDKVEQYLLEHRNNGNGDKRLLREVAYERLYDALRNVDVEPGDPLPEMRLSNALGISRTPVREALQQLAADGLIQFIQGRAITIAPRSAQEVFDALHVRELLEPQAVKLCATVMSMHELERLQRLTSEMEETARLGDRAGWSRADREWHEVVCTACSNKLLGQMVLLARNRMYHRGSDEHVPAQYLIDGTEEHKRVVEAIIAHDAERAEQLMHKHLLTLRENIVNRFVR
jgi:GntR family transcriptional regulator, vanillate catabolism transcriptional regulator